MKVAEYVATREPFTDGDLSFEIWNGGRVFATRLVCHSLREANDNGTNGEWMDKFYAFLTKRQITRVVQILTAESRQYGIQFTLDDRQFRGNGRDAFLFYKMHVLRSRLV